MLITQMPETIYPPVTNLLGGGRISFLGETARLVWESMEDGISLTGGILSVVSEVGTMVGEGGTMVGEVGTISVSEGVEKVQGGTTAGGIAEVLETKLTNVGNVLARGGWTDTDGTVNLSDMFDILMEVLQLITC